MGNAMRDDGRDGEVADDNWLKRVTDTVEGEQEEECDNILTKSP